MSKDIHNPVTVVLDNVRSAHNVGAIFRCCDAFGVKMLLLCGITAYPPHKGIEKTALGATESVQWIHQQSTVEAIQTTGIARRIAVEVGADAKPLQGLSIRTEEPVLFVFGHEVTGIHPDVCAICTEQLHIPQMGQKTSLNVSVAAGIVLWKVAELRIFQS